MAADILRQHGHTVHPSPTQGPGDATQIARHSLAHGADLILAAGGDGTINEVLNGMIGSSVPLGVLPAGTANVLAMETGMGYNPVGAASNLSSWQPLPIRPGLARNPDGSIRRYFICMAGAGLDAFIVRNVNPRAKRTLGKGAYWLAGFSSATRTLEEMHATLPADTRRVSFALLSRVRNYGGDLEIARNASLLQPHLGAYLFEGGSAFRYFKYFAAVLLGNAHNISGITATQLQSLHLEPANGNTVYLQLDGEDAGALPASIELAPDSIQLLLPSAYIRREQNKWKI